jgi:uncharacterized protein (DUF2252 family)
MTIQQSTHAYERWLAKRMPLLPADLRLKHQLMAENLFSFLRATFYRWSQLWPEVCPGLVSSPLVLAVGDLHVENFGTWRDSEGRLIWGVNDFDEASWLAYPNDLVRLAASAHLAVQENHLSCDIGSICDSILAGYSEAMQQGGMPFVLAERHRWLRDLATSDLRDPVRFWDKLERFKDVTGAVPRQVKLALMQALPELKINFRVVHRQAGLGSLGRRRFTALAEWRGGLIAREAKELAPSAWDWERKRNQTDLLYEQIIQRSVRVADPCLRLHANWLMRRLAPDCSRIVLGSLPLVKDELKLLHAMGWETANIHLGTKSAAKQIQKDLHKRPARWLLKAASAMTKAIVRDWNEWRKTS